MARSKVPNPSQHIMAFPAEKSRLDLDCGVRVARNP
jgi:hypothetical protein